MRTRTMLASTAILGFVLGCQGTGTIDSNATAQNNNVPNTTTNTSPTNPTTKATSGTNSANTSTAANSSTSQATGTSTGVTPRQIKYGATIAHRLNATEYNNSVNHLFDLELDLFDTLSRQSRGGGFLNVASNLNVLPRDSETFLTVATQISEAVLNTPNSRALLTQGCSGAQDTTRACAQNIAQSWLPRIWRSEVSKEEEDAIVGLWDETMLQDSATFDDGVSMMLTAALVSPKFLFRIPSLQDNAQGTERRLNQYEIATRLSFFLWASTPDDELLQLAKEGRLIEPATLEEQVERMLKSPKISPFATQFFEAWIGIDWLRQNQGNDPAQTGLFIEETVRMFWYVMAENRPFHELLNADYMFVDHRTAGFYGIPAPEAKEGWVKTTIDPALYGPRRGILGHGSFLTRYQGVVHRGLALAETLRCRNLHGALPESIQMKLAEQQKQLASGTLSEIDAINLRAADTACTGCHGTIDSLGYSFFEFDDEGNFRQNDELGKPIDPTVKWPSGQTFNDGWEALQSLTDDPEVEQCMVRRLLGFATGRKVKTAEREVYQALWSDWKSKGTGLRTLVKSIALSDAFQTRDPGAIVIPKQQNN